MGITKTIANKIRNTITMKQYSKDIFTPQNGVEVVEDISDEDLALINKFSKKRLRLYLIHRNTFRLKFLNLYKSV